MSGSKERNPSKGTPKGAGGGAIDAGQPASDDLGQSIEDILNWCYAAAHEGFGGKELAPDAKTWWFGHYRVYFHYAICVKHRRWERDGRTVLIAARILGQHAAEIASGHTITKADVQKASTDLDCTMLLKELAPMVPTVPAIWCAP